ncbi:hypothetical protein SDJN02_13407, partial [Cucurbita argyrosperma subsp. argyrosperma]
MEIEGPEKKKSKETTSIWKCLKSKISSGKKEGTTSKNEHGKFSYDAVSYAQNFDDGLANADDEGSSRSFSARYAVASKPPPKKK